MEWSINDQEFQSVIGLPTEKRYLYSIKRMADYESIWSLYTSDGWVLASDPEGNELFPIWPHSRYASACATEAWYNAVPQAISLDDWIDRWLPGLMEDNRLVSVFPTPLLKGVVVTPGRMKDDLLEELEKIQ